MAAPAMWPETRLSWSASRSTTAPRHRLRNSERGRIAANCSAPKMPSFSGRPSTCSETVSASPSSSSRVVDAARVAERQPVDDVVEDHAHAQRLGHHGQLGADVAVADDAERAAAHLVRADWRTCPRRPACISRLRSVSRRASAMISAMASSTTERVLEYGALKTATPASVAAVQVDLVGADAEGADGAELRRRLEDGARDVGARSDAEVVDALEGGDQVALGQRPGPGVDLVALGLESLDGVGVDVLK